MADSGERVFKLAATVGSVEKGQDLTRTAHVVILRWLNEPAPWSEFESRLQELFSQSNPFTHPDAPMGPTVGRRVPKGTDQDALVRELTGMSLWPRFGMEALVHRLGGQLLDEDFVPQVVGTPPLRQRLAFREGKDAKFGSIAVVEQQKGDTQEEVLFSHPVINSVRKAKTTHETAA